MLDSHKNFIHGMARCAFCGNRALCCYCCWRLLDRLPASPKSRCGATRSRLLWKRRRRLCDGSSLLRASGVLKSITVHPHGSIQRQSRDLPDVLQYLGQLLVDKVPLALRLTGRLLYLNCRAPCVPPSTETTVGGWIRSSRGFSRTILATSSHRSMLQFKTVRCVLGLQYSDHDTGCHCVLRCAGAERYEGAEDCRLPVQLAAGASA